jgi:hypothetical protein
MTRTTINDMEKLPAVEVVCLQGRLIKQGNVVDDISSLPVAYAFCQDDPVSEEAALRKQDDFDMFTVGETNRGVRTRQRQLFQTAAEQAAVRKELKTSKDRQERDGGEEQEELKQPGKPQQQDPSEGNCQIEETKRQAEEMQKHGKVEKQDVSQKAGKAELHECNLHEGYQQQPQGVDVHAEGDNQDHEENQLHDEDEPVEEKQEQPNERKRHYSKSSSEEQDELQAKKARTENVDQRTRPAIDSASVVEEDLTVTSKTGNNKEEGTPPNSPATHATSQSASSYTGSANEDSTVATLNSQTPSAKALRRRSRTDPLMFKMKKGSPEL